MVIGYVEVIVLYWVLDDVVMELYIVVIDSGVGIVVEVKDRLFVLFE